MLVNEIMAKHVITIESDKTILEACNRYNDYKIGCLLAMKNEKIVGIVTERDIISRVIVNQKNPATTKIEEVMSKNIKSIHPQAPIMEAANVMGDYKIKKLPVIDENGTLHGIITISDIIDIIPNYLKSIAEGDTNSFRYESGPHQQAKV